MRKRTLFRLAAGTAALGAATLAYASLVERNMFTLRRYDVPVLPADAEPLRILHLSDLHMMPDQGRKQRWVASLAALDPDLVVVTGDNMAHPDAVPGVLRALQPLLDLPGAFVFGSNDYTGPVLKNPFSYFLPDREYTEGVELPHEELRDVLVSAGWTDLNNARTTVKAGGRVVELLGVDDPHVERDDYDSVAGPVSPSADLSIALTHSPSRPSSTGWPPTASGCCSPGTPTAVRSAYRGSARWSPTAACPAPWRAACTVGPGPTPGCTSPPGSAPTRPRRSGSPARRRRACSP